MSSFYSCGFLISETCGILNVLKDLFRELLTPAVTNYGLTCLGINIYQPFKDSSTTPLG